MQTNGLYNNTISIVPMVWCGLTGNDHLQPFLYFQQILTGFNGDITDTAATG